MSPSSSKNDVAQIQLPEVIDERADLDALFGKTRPVVRIDCGKVKRINSVGIRTLMLTLVRLEKEGAKLVFTELTPPMVEASDFISNLLPKGVTVESIFLPYCCTACQHLFMVLHPTAQIAGKGSAIEHSECVKCGGDAEFDHVPELYFKWISSLASE